MLNHCALSGTRCRVLCISAHTLRGCGTRCEYAHERKYIHTRFILLPEIESYIMKKIRHSCCGVCVCVSVCVCVIAGAVVVVASHSGGLPIWNTRTQVAHRVECWMSVNSHVSACVLIGNVVISVDTHALLIRGQHCAVICQADFRFRGAGARRFGIAL